MTIKVTCPNGHKLAAKDSKAGTTASCPACGAKIQIPSLENKACTESAVLRILGIGEELRKSHIASDDSMLVPPEILLKSTQQKKTPGRTTQVCPQCDWEIDAGYHVCPHCHYYLMGKMDDF